MEPFRSYKTLRPSIPLQPSGKALFSITWLFILLSLPASGIFSQQDLSAVEVLTQEKKYDEAHHLVTTLLPGISPADSQQYIKAHTLLANIQYGQKAYQKSIQTREKLAAYLPSRHAEQGDNFFKMGQAFIKLGDYEGFLQSNEAAARAYAATFGKEAIQYTRALNSLGYAHYLNGSYKESEKVLLEARRIKERNNAYDMQYGRILNQLGKSHMVLNKFQEAEECIVASLKVKEKLKGKSQDYAITQSTYAILLQSIGRYEDALQQIEEALTLASHPYYKVSFKQIKAGLLHALEDYHGAIALYEELKTERMNLEGAKSSDYAKILLDLSDLFIHVGEPEKALSHAEEACDVFEKIHGNSHPYYAKAIRQKADVQLEQGQTEGLETIYKTSSRIIARKYSKRHIEYFKSEYAYFRYLKKTKDYPRAVIKIEQIDDIITSFIIEASKYLSIQEIIEVTDLYHQYFQEILSLTSLNPDNAVLTAKAFDCSLFYKGYILEALLSIKKAIRRSKAITELSEQLTSLKIQLSAELEKAEKSDARITGLQDEIDLVEIDIARNLGQLRREDERMSWDLLQFELSSDEAAVDFVRFADEQNNDFLYAAMILLPDAEAPRFLTLFLESDITRYFDDKMTSSSEWIAKLYRYANRGFSPKEELENISLYDLIWKPIAPHLKGISTVYYVCDGIVHNIALHAIPTDLESVVSDSVQLLQMTSFRNMVRGKAAEYGDRIEKALLIGGVKYGTSSDTTSNRDGRWNDLPWAEREVDEIAGLMNDKDFPFEAMKGEKAQKSILLETIRTSPDFRILHFATHGFFTTEDLLGIKSKIDVNKANIELTRSGLVLANANQLERSDALLTAFEISELDLADTELVVLSACETGLGQVYEYEGVYGMQRAFKIAGAEYIIMSLWQVPDRDTKVFMTDFYENYLIEGLSIPDAFYKTQKKMKDRVFEPEKWAGFVLLK